jgi:preprotein translocase subunit Sss1
MNKLSTFFYLIVELFFAASSMFMAGLFGYLIYIIMKPLLSLM